MSIVIEYNPEKARKESLRDFLISEGFVKCKYFLSPFPKGSLYLSWFDETQYKSMDGIEAVVYPNEENSNGNKWAIFTRSRVWASAYDKQKQNEVIKNARKLFGGNFYNDSAGKNRYTVIDKTEFILPQESGIFQVYERIKSQIVKLKGAIDDHKESSNFDLKPGTHKDIVKMVNDNRPSLALYNSLLPFLVSVLEHYFRELFTVLIEFDKTGHSRIQDLKLRELKEFNTVEDIYKIAKKEDKIESLIAKGYNFQNLELVTQTFKKHLDIDIKRILKTRKKIGRKTVMIFDELEDLIQRRHWMIHHFGFSTDVDKEKYIYFLNLTNSAIDLITLELEKTKGFKIVNRSIYYGLDI